MVKSKWRLLIYVNHALVAIFNVANMSFNALRENKVLAEISGFTVPNCPMMAHTYMNQSNFDKLHYKDFHKAKRTEPSPLAHDNFRLTLEGLTDTHLESGRKIQLLLLFFTKKAYFSNGDYCVQNISYQLTMTGG